MNTTEQIHYLATDNSEINKRNLFRGRSENDEILKYIQNSFDIPTLREPIDELCVVKNSPIQIRTKKTELIDKIKKFLTIKNLNFENDNVSAVVIFGSTVSGLRNKNSDIDLQIITKSPNCIRSSCIFENSNIEYFINSKENILDKQKQFSKSNYSLFKSVCFNPLVIFDKSNIITEIQNELSKINFEKLEQNKLFELCVIIYNRLKDLEMVKPEEFNLLYYLTLNKIINLCSYLTESAILPEGRLTEYLQNDKLSNFKNLDINYSKEIKTMILKCLSIENNQNAQQNLLDLFNLCIKDFNFDLDTYEINF